MTSSAKLKRKVLRFGLLELLLATGVIAAWLPSLIAMRQIPELESKIKLYRNNSSELLRVDPNQLCLRKLQRHWYGTTAWKYFLPAGAPMELRFNEEQISSLTLPSQYEAVKLPEGEHRIYLREFTDTNSDYVKQIYVDDEIVLTTRHPKSWLKNNGSSSWSNKTFLQSVAYPLNEPLELKKAQYSGDYYVGKGNTTYYQLPKEYDAKGSCLWIAPTDHVAEPTPNFVSPRTPKCYNNYWGHREGIRIEHRGPGAPGLIKVVGGFESRTVNPSQAYNTISVRPIVATNDDANDGIEKPELPELQQSYNNRRPGLGIGLSQSLDSPHWDNPSPLDRTGPQKAISRDGKIMRIFCHFGKYSSGFPSGARPVLETIFDSDHPNRIGLLPHQAADSMPIKAVQIVTTMDARFRRRRANLIIDGDVETVPLPKLEKTVDESSGKSRSNVEAGNRSEDAWQTIPLAQIPIDSSDQVRKLKFSTDVKDFTTAKLPTNVDPKWVYKGVKNCQTWWLPLSDGANQTNHDCRVEILQTDQLPTEVPPPATVTIPGGPVIKSVRITIPMPAKEPIWLEMTPDYE